MISDDDPPSLPPGYQLRTGSGLDRAMLVKFMQRTYSEVYPNQDFSHLAKTVEQFYSKDTPLWWIEFSDAQISPTPPLPPFPTPPLFSKVACLWMGSAIDQVENLRHAHIFLLYVAPSHRRQGIAKALMSVGENWANMRGDRQISLQVFSFNQPAVNLYHQLGYQIQSFWMVKRLL